MKLTFAVAFIATAVLGVTALPEPKVSHLQVRAVMRSTHYYLI